MAPLPCKVISVSPDSSTEASSRSNAGQSVSGGFDFAGERTATSHEPGAIDLVRHVPPLALDFVPQQHPSMNRGDAHATQNAAERLPIGVCKTMCERREEKDRWATILRDR